MNVQDQLHDIFGKDYTGTLPEKVEDVKDRLEKGELVVTEELTKPQTIEDKDYLKKTLKDMVELGMGVLTTLKSDLKLGAPGHVGENFSLVYKSITESVQRLVELNIKLFDIDKVEEVVNPGPQNQQNNFFMGTGRELNDLLKGVVKKQREISDLNRIELKADESGDGEGDGV